MRKNQKATNNSYRKLLSLLNRPQKLKFIYLVVLMLINAFLEMAGIGAIPGLILLIGNSQKINKVPYVGEWLGTLNAQDPAFFFICAVCGLFGIFLVKNFFFIYLNYEKAGIVRNFQVYVSKKLMNRYLTAPYSFHLKSDHAELLRNVNSEVNQLVTQVLIQLLTFFLDFFIAVSILLVLFLAEPMISLCAFGVLGVISLIFLKVTRKKVEDYGQRAKVMRKRKARFILNSLNLIKEIKVLTRERFFHQKFSNTIQKEAFYALHKEVFSKIPRAILEVSAMGLMLGILLYLYLGGNNIEEMVAILALFAVSAARLMPVISQMSTAMTNVRYSLPSVDTVYEEFNRVKAEELDMGDENSQFTLNEGFIELKNLCFSYETDKLVLDNINTVIPVGASVAFVGPSGAGKSTLVDMVMGLLDPNSGSIEVEGKSIHGCKKAWRQCFGYVPQQIIMINDTLRNNICLGLMDDEIDDERLDKVIQQTQLMEIVNKLPEGLNTMMGENGVKLSGGQRQRVGIARALYVNPKVLVLDEATSALDGQTERNIVESINRLRSNRTVITIAHRLSTVKDCDIIFYMENGRLIDQGNYDVLLTRSPGFKNLVALSTV